METSRLPQPALDPARAVARELVNTTSLWLGGMVPVSTARQVAQAFLALTDRDAQRAAQVPAIATTIIEQCGLGPEARGIIEAQLTTLLG